MPQAAIDMAFVGGSGMVLVMIWDKMIWDKILIWFYFTGVGWDSDSYQHGSYHWTASSAMVGNVPTPQFMNGGGVPM